MENIEYDTQLKTQSLIDTFIDKIETIKWISDTTLGPFSYLGITINNSYSIMIEDHPGDVISWWKFWKKEPKHIMVIYLIDIKSDKKYEITKDQFREIFKRLPNTIGSENFIREVNNYSLWRDYLDDCENYRQCI